MIIMDDFSPHGFQSFSMLTRVPQSIGMTILKTFTNKQIEKNQWHGKSFSEQLDIDVSIDILKFY